MLTNLIAWMFVCAFVCFENTCISVSVFLNLLNTAFLYIPPPFSLSVCVYLCVWASDEAVVGLWSDQSVAAVQWVVSARLGTMLVSVGTWQRSSPHPDRAYSSQPFWLFPHARCQKVSQQLHRSCYRTWNTALTCSTHTQRHKNMYLDTYATLQIDTAL